MLAVENLELWLKNTSCDEEISKELEFIKNNEVEINKRFSKNLEFGTAGLRGLMGAGSNMMNIYTVRLATQGLANYLNEKGKNLSVAVSYDSRNNSKKFAEEAARVLAANCIKVFLVDSLQPTPVLSYAVRYFNCSAGIMITASHNPAEYNGYKCYSKDGAQMNEEDSLGVMSCVKKLRIFEDVFTIDFKEAFDKNLIEYIPEKFYESYVKEVLSQRINFDAVVDAKLDVVYTPLNGTGTKLVEKVLKDIGLKKLHTVEEQRNPDGDFPTCRYPNPEVDDAFIYALKLANKNNSDLIIATDPDCDRVGVMVKDNFEYKKISGNKVGILLTHYILSQKYKNGKLPLNPVIMKSIVSSPIVDEIAKDYNCEVKTVLTGFKYIGEKIYELEKLNELSRFVFAFEESCGYLPSFYTRDKDGVVAAMLICEMTAYYKSKGLTLIQVLEKIYSKYGFYEDKTLSFEFSDPGIILNIMDYVRNKKSIFKNIKNKCDLLFDYKNFGVPKSNVVIFTLEDKSTIIIRPSGTEPKIKVYITSVSREKEMSKKINAELFCIIKEIINSFKEEKNK